MSLDVKEKIITAAMTAYAESGFQGATTRRVAEIAGVNEVTIFRNFGSKAALMDEAAKIGAIAGLGQMGANAKDAVKDLRKVVADEDKKSKLGKAAQQALKVIVVKKK